MAKKRIGIAAGAVLLTCLGVWLMTWQPWQREVSISTTREAFVGPVLIRAAQSGVVLSLQITPAPWPAEAFDIWKAANHGKLVHITVHHKDRTLAFDITGTSSQGELLVPCRSANEAWRIVDLLGIKRSSVRERG
jgi:hypothetical protein